MNLAQLTPVLSGKVVTATGLEVTGTWSFCDEQTIGGSKVQAATIFPDKNETRSFTAQFTPTDADAYGNTLTTDVIPIMSDLTVSNDVVASLADTNKSTSNTDWYVGDVTVNAPDGYLISTTAGTGADSWSTSLTVSADCSGDYTYYLRDNGTDSTTKNGITAAKTITINKDSTKPVLGTASYKQGTDSIIAGLWNWLFGKSVITVFIPITESGSGIDVSNVSISLNKDEICTLASVSAGDIALTGSMAEGYTLSFTIPEGFIGTYSVQVSDNAGNAAAGMNNEPVNGKLVVDTTAPQITMQGIVTTTAGTETYDFAENWYTNAQTIHITVDDGENSSGIASVTYKKDDEAEQTLYAVNSTLDSTYTKDIVAEEGTHTYTVKACDNAGNTVATKSVTIKVDTAAPTGEASISNNKWNSFLNTVTFGLFFNETQTVSVDATDSTSGIAKTEYYESDKALTLEEVKEITSWTAGASVPVTAEDTKQFVCYFKLTDNAGNITYLSSDGVEYDLTAPAFSIAEGSVLYTTQSVTVTDRNLDSVTLNGKSEGSPIALEGNKDDSYTLKAKDKAGNTTSITVYMKTIASLDDTIEGITTENVKSSDKATVSAVKSAIKSVIEAVDITSATTDEKKELTAISDNCNTLLTKIDATSAEIIRINNAVGNYTSETVKSSDKTDIEKLITDIDALSGTNNVTEDEKTGLATVKTTANELLEKIAATAEEIARITKAVDSYDITTAKHTDHADIQQLVTDIDTLNATNNVTEDEKNTLNGYKQKLESLLSLTENKATPTVDTPTVTGFTYDPGKTLKDVSIISGTNSVEGSWSWKTKETVPTVNNNGYTAVFTPDDTDNYNTVEKTVTVAVTKATPTVDTPTAAGITYDSGKTLKDVPIISGTNSVEGSWSWKTKDTVPAVNNNGYTAVFTPNDTDNYNTVEKTVTVTVTRATPDVDTPTVAGITYDSGKSLKDVPIILGTNSVEGSWSWKTLDTVPMVNNNGYTAVFTPDDTDNYNTVEKTVTVKVTKATPTVDTPTVTGFTYDPGKTLNTVSIISGTNSVEGSWSWKTKDTVPAVNNNGYTAVFTPDDADNYNTVEKTVTVAVTKATPVVDVLPTASAITYGQTLSDSVLSNGNAKYSDSNDTAVTGSYAWKAGTTKPAVADSNTTEYDVTFTPSDTVNYNGFTVKVKLTVNKADSAPNMPGTTMAPAHSKNTVGDVTLPTDWIWNTEDAAKTLSDGVAVTATALYNGTDKGNYENEFVVITLTRANCEHDYVAKITKQPTTTEEGVRTYTCSRCGDTYTESIPKLPSDTSEPQIEGEDGKKGWDVITDTVDNAKEGDTVTIDMNGTTTVPGNVIDNIKGKDITVIIDLGDEITWTINGKDVTADNVKDIDFGVTTGTTTIPVDVINMVTGEKTSIQVSLNYDGEFGFTATLSVNMDKKNAGYYANLFYYNESAAKLEFMNAGMIAADGMVDLVFTHASDYTIVIADVVMDGSSTEEPVTSESGNTEESVTSESGTEESVTSESSTERNCITDEEQNAAQTGDSTDMWKYIWLELFSGAILIVGLASTVSKKKKEIK